MIVDQRLNNKILFQTLVGSHIWKMNTPESDWDLFECFLIPTREVLKGKVPHNSFTQNKEKKVDIQKQEIAQVTSEIIKSNINYIGYIFSPIILIDNGFLDGYKQWAKKVLSKQVYNSTRGLAIHNYQRYSKEGDFYSKKINQVLRVLKLGITLMYTGEIHFEPITNGTEELYHQYLADLDTAKENGSLQEYPQEEDINNLWNYVINFRLLNLK